MKTTILAALALVVTLPSSQSATITLAEFALKIDDAIVLHGPPTLLNPLLDPIPSGLDGSGLGTLSVALTPGSHYVSLFVDHEIDEVANTFFNEFGTAVGSPATDQSWEIDEPGWVFGDIYDNFVAGTLDNSNGVPAALPDDVSMALGWNLTLASWQSATVSFNLSESAPGSGFYLIQTDPDSGSSVYFSSSVRVTGSQPGVPDGGSTLALLLCSFGGLAGWRCKHKSLS